MKTEQEYIPSQRLYVAVKSVEQEVREWGKRTDAVKRISGMLDLDPEELEACLKARRKRRAKSHPSKASGQKYQYFLIVKKKIANKNTKYSDPSVRRGLTEETVLKKFFQEDMKETMMSMSKESGYYGNPVSHIVLCAFPDKSSAEKALECWENYLTY